MSIISDDHKNTVYYKIIRTILSALPLALAKVISYNHKWCHNLKHHLWLSFMIAKYDHKIFMIQDTVAKFWAKVSIENFSASILYNKYITIANGNPKWRSSSMLQIVASLMIVIDDTS